MAELFVIDIPDENAAAASGQKKRERLKNTIGLQYWLIQFLAQCVNYVLVLIGVFMQIYRYEHESAVNGTFIAIVVFSSVFLWFKVCIQSGRSACIYVSSGRKYQELFELRVIRGVCKFVAIIIYIISSIRVFFFIVAGGIFAFSVAIIHVLHTCYRAAHDYFPETIFYTATPQEVREYRKNTQRILEEKSAIVDAPTPAIAETKTQVPVSGGDGGGCGSSGSENVQQHHEITRADSGAEEGKDEGALMAMLKQFQEEQKLTRAEQHQTREEQQRAFEELRLAHEEQRQTAAELRKEVALLKEQLEANRDIV
ncbi:hypothetical protein BGZ91_005358 [Linnemannia elongata]|nr:hypothetical protein BGZ91_005358 [Linnemannia elongata]